MVFVPKSERVGDYKDKQRQKQLLTGAGILGVAGGAARVPWAAKGVARAAARRSPRAAAAVARVPGRARLSQIERQATAASTPLAIGSGAVGSTSSLIYANRLKRETAREGKKLGMVAKSRNVREQRSRLAQQYRRELPPDQWSYKGANARRAYVMNRDDAHRIGRASKDRTQGRIARVDSRAQGFDSPASPGQRRRVRPQRSYIAQAEGPILRDVQAGRMNRMALRNPSVRSYAPRRGRPPSRAVRVLRRGAAGALVAGAAYGGWQLTRKEKRDNGNALGGVYKRSGVYKALPPGYMARALPQGSRSLSQLSRSSYGVADGVVRRGTMESGVLARLSPRGPVQGRFPGATKNRHGRRRRTQPLHGQQRTGRALPGGGRAIPKSGTDLTPYTGAAGRAHADEMIQRWALRESARTGQSPRNLMGSRKGRKEYKRLSEYGAGIRKRSDWRAHVSDDAKKAHDQTLPKYSRSYAADAAAGGAGAASGGTLAAMGALTRRSTNKYADRWTRRGFNPVKAGRVGAGLMVAGGATGALGLAATKRGLERRSGIQERRRKIRLRGHMRAAGH